MPRSAKGRGQSWYVLAILTLVYTLNIADRYSISTVIEPIRLELKLSDSGVAFLTGVALALFYVTIGIPVAVFADRANRRNIIVVSLALWSVMTTFCGLARNYGQLLLARFGVGIGEAGGTPPSTSILADVFPPERRPMAFTVFALGACLGAWLGSSAAGAVADFHGWRAVFLVFGIPGLLCALIVRITVREPRRGQLDHGITKSIEASRGHRHSVSASVRWLLEHRSPFHLILGGSVATLWSWGLMWWTPTFLVRSYHLTAGQAGGALGPMHLVGGTGGTLFASWLMSRRAAADPQHVCRVVAWVTGLMTVPSFLAYAIHSKAASTLMLWTFVPGVYFFIGPILGLLQNVVPANQRATACAIFVFVANVGNLIIAPQLVGWLSDWISLNFAVPEESLRSSLLVLAPTGFWAAWHLWAAQKTIVKDAALASGSSDGKVLQPGITY
jgi:MFS family permease